MWRFAIKNKGKCFRMVFDQDYLETSKNILVKVDRATMANSLEARVPLLDHRLLEFLARMPVNYKINGKTSK